jgi:hypothetical protein
MIIIITAAMTQQQQQQQLMHKLKSDIIDPLLSWGVVPPLELDPPSPDALATPYPSNPKLRAFRARSRPLLARSALD